MRLFRFRMFNSAVWDVGFEVYDFGGTVHDS